MKKKIHSKLHLKDVRRQLRNNGTSAEAFLWTYLKLRQLDGRKFRRQHSIENAVVDFYCPSEKLIIELDGQAHFQNEGKLWDSKRDADLMNLGFTVMRFENNYVFKHVDRVLEEIRSEFKS